jgi:hypothetical protein
MCVASPTGSITIVGGVAIAPNPTLLTNYPAMGPGTSEGDGVWAVDGSITVASAGRLLLDCSPHIGCSATAADVVNGPLDTVDAAGVVLHSTTIPGGVTPTSGGVGLTCAPGRPIPSYDGLEDHHVDGNVVVTHLETCWFGALRNRVGGSVIITGNQFANPDANEVMQNVITGNLVCLDNNPAAQSGDSGASPNFVGGSAVGECAPLRRLSTAVRAEGHVPDSAGEFEVW